MCGGKEHQPVRGCSRALEAHGAKLRVLAADVSAVFVGFLRTTTTTTMPNDCQQGSHKHVYVDNFAACCCCCRGEAYRLVAYYLALQHHKPTPAQRRPLTFDQHLLSSISTASKLTGGSWTSIAASCEAFVGAKLAGGLQAHPPRCSDIVWGAAGMAAAVLVLGVLAAAARTLPLVGPLHANGVPLLLGSFGTLAILLFGKPEAEPVRLWSVIAGQLGATAIVITVLHVWGASLASRAAAMAATVAWQMWTDSIHPPGGGLCCVCVCVTASSRPPHRGVKVSVCVLDESGWL